MQKIAIIGSGIAGLTVAKELNQYCNVEIFEKSRGVGGRMATRRIQNYHFDHGAQFFIAKTTQFREFINPLIKNNIVVRWNPRFVEMERDKIIRRRNWDGNFPHYVGVPGMTGLAKYIADGMIIRLNSKVAKIQKNNNMWELYDCTNKILGRFNWVIFAIPPNQIRDITGNTIFKYFNFCKNITMKGCYTLMLGFEDKINLSWDAALIHKADISWISVNSSKPQREKNFCMVICSTNLWADNNMHNADNKVISHLLNETASVIKYDVERANCVSLHRWKYANISKQESIEPLIDYDNRFAACGDWCIHGRVEAAFTSGYKIGSKIREFMM
ncbi:MAG: FAD-dependent oxidoreductase [Legionellales bacterium]|nr:FAD-dependent oxidoreductase [Legionellales bacterium]